MSTSALRVVRDVQISSPGRRRRVASRGPRLHDLIGLACGRDCSARRRRASVSGRVFAPGAVSFSGFPVGAALDRCEVKRAGLRRSFIRRAELILLSGFDCAPAMSRRSRRAPARSASQRSRPGFRQGSSSNAPTALVGGCCTRESGGRGAALATVFDLEERGQN
jgi:hypothetical protein